MQSTSFLDDEGLHGLGLRGFSFGLGMVVFKDTKLVNCSWVVLIGFFASVALGNCLSLSWRPSYTHPMICQSTNGNGKPLNGNSNGSSESIPAYETFDQAGIMPLGQGWDPWKQSSRYPSSGSGEADTSVRNPGGETSGRDDVDLGFRSTGSKYGVVGNEGEEPFRILPDGRKAYLDELDVLTLLVPPPFLKPMSSVNYNHAAFLW